MFVKCLFLLYFVIVIHSQDDVPLNNDYFNIHVYDALDTQERADKNIVYSPLSIYTLLALIYQGSAGNTELALQKVLRLSSKREMAEKFQDVLKLLGEEANITMDIATMVCVRDSFRLNENFKDVAKGSFLAESASLNMDDAQQAADKVNNWVIEKTHGKISQLIGPDDFDSGTRSVLLSAAYFKGEWKIQFNKKETVTMPFYETPTKTVDCRMMHRKAIFYYNESKRLNAQILMLQFQDTRFNLLVILPKYKTRIENLQKKITETNSISLSGRSLVGSPREVDVYLPRFKIESKHDLKEPLTDLGLGEIFADNAAFPNIIDQENISVSKFAQRATIEINEMGGIASAATETVAQQKMNPLPPTTFRADHPFLFLLTVTVGYGDDESRPREVVLFMGKVKTPEIAN